MITTLDFLVFGDVVECVSCMQRARWSFASILIQFKFSTRITMSSKEKRKHEQIDNNGEAIQAYKRLKRWVDEKSKTDANDVVRPGQSLAKGYSDKAVAFEREGKWEEGIKALQHATELDPNNSTYHHLLANVGAAAAEAEVHSFLLNQM
jgi:tetratricopeptide (TPR) repeat protein